MTLQRPKYRVCHFCPGSVCLKQFLENIFPSVTPIQEVLHTEVHCQKLQFLGVTFEMRY